MSPDPRRRIYPAECDASPDAGYRAESGLGARQLGFYSLPGDQFGENQPMSPLNHKADESSATATATATATAAKVTTLLNEAGAGDPRAAAELLPLVYKQLRALAGRRMRHERGDQTLQATALVHEAYLRLVDNTRVQLWESRWHFFAAAAESMRRILVDHARRRGRIKRGGALNRIELDDVELTVNGPPDELIALDEALNELAREQPQKAQLVNL